MPTATKKLPKHWQIDTKNMSVYDACIDPGVKYNGKPAVLISSDRAASSDYLHLCQSMDGNAWYGKRVRFSCAVKTEDVDCHATLSVSVKAPPGDLLVYDPMIDRSLTGTNDWTELVVVVDIPSEGRWISYGPCLWGKGKMWAADFRIEQVSKDIERTDDHGSTGLFEPAPVNLDFSDVSSENAPRGEDALLSGWSWPGENTNFKFSVLKDALDGDNAAVIQSLISPNTSDSIDLKDEKNHGYLCQGFSAKSFRGSRVAFSAFMKTENVTEEAVLVLMVNGVNNARLALSRMDSLAGDNDWSEHSLVLDVSEFAYSISIWLQMAGPGKALFSKVAVRKVSDTVPTTDGNHHPRNLDFSQ